MQVLNKPDVKNKTSITLKVIEDEPKDLCGYTFLFQGKSLRLFQFSAGQYVACFPRSFNRWNDGVIRRGFFKEDMEKYYPNWKPL